MAMSAKASIARLRFWAVPARGNKNGQNAKAHKTDAPPRPLGLRGARSFAVVAGGIVSVSVVLPVELSEKLIDAGLKLQEKYCNRDDGRLQTKLTGAATLVAVHGIE